MLSLLHTFRGKKIVVIGDIMLDHYIIGDVHRISPEAPVPVVKAQKDVYTLGGAANVALNLANVGVNVSLAGYSAHDEAGIRLKQELENAGISSSFPLAEAGGPTIIKTRVIIRGQQLCRIDREAERKLYNLALYDAYEEVIREITDTADGVIISDYAKGTITQELIDALVNSERFKSGELFIAADPKPSRKLQLSNLSLLTPNKSEAFELADMNAQEAEGDWLEKICATIYEKYQPQLLIVTLGAEGMAISREGKLLKVLPTVARQVYDVSGAGDTVIAMLTAALVSGADAESAATLANIAAGEVVSKHGTAAIKLEELQALLTR